MASANDPGDGDRHPIVPPDAPPKPENPLLKHFAWAPMWVENSNALFTVVGDPGDGKSWASLRMAEVVDPTFNIDRVAWDIIDFMQLVMDDSIGRGKVIILEEGEVDASAYEWHSKSNKVFRTVLDTWRHQNRMAIINLPSFQALEKGARRRTDFIVEMTDARPWKDYSTAKFKKARTDNIEDNFTTPFQKVEGKERRRIRFRPPSDDLREAYEKQKEEYTAELNQELLEELLAESETEEEASADPEAIADEIIEQDKLDDYIGDNYGNKYIDRDMIELDFDIGHSKSKKVKKLLMRKTDFDGV